MKKVHYSKITIEGFQSICKPMSFKLDNVGLNLIKGVNGVGKSTVFNAVLWAEYGGNMKKSVASWLDVRTDGFRGTRVVIERTDGEYDYMIVRHLAFKGTTKGLAGGDKLMIFKKLTGSGGFTDADLVGDGLHKTDMQLMIQDQIGMDSRTFLNSIIFGQRMASFVETDNKDKRALFEQLFNVGFVDNARLLAKEEEAKLMSEISVVETRYEGVEKSLEELQAKLIEQTEVIEEFETVKKGRIKVAKDNLDESKAAIATTKKAIKQYQDQLAKYDLNKAEELQEELDNHQQLAKVAKQTLSESEIEVDDIQKEITKAIKNRQDLERQLTEINTTCPSCLQALPKSKIELVKKNISDQIKKEQEVEKTQSARLEIAKKHNVAKLMVDSEIKKSIAKVQESLDTYSTDKEEAATTKANLAHKESRLKEIELGLIKLQTALKTEQDAKPPKIDLDTTRNKIQELSDNIESFADDIETRQYRLTRVQWWITKGFGVSGLKAFVFNAMLAQLNLFSHKYSARLGFRVEFSIDMTKASKPFQTLIYKGDTIKDYEDLSGGQKQRVDIVIAFAMHDLISFNSDINILVMDELFEGLDNEGVEAAFELIREKAEQKSVYLITHADFVDTLNSRSVTFELDEEGSTYLKN